MLGYTQIQVRIRRDHNICVEKISREFYLRYFKKFVRKKIKSGTSDLYLLSPQISLYLKGLSHEIDLKNFNKNLQNWALIRAAAGF